MRFSIGTILWAFALLAAALTTFGLLGMLYAFGVVWIWVLLFERARPSSVQIRFSLVVLLVALALVIPIVQTPFVYRSRDQCFHNLKQIGLALSLCAEDGRAILRENWRTNLLPYAADVDETSTNLSGAVASYQCMADHSTTKTPASYFAIADARCAWSAGTEQLDSIPDGPANTILILEALNQNIAWISVEELAFEQALELLTSPEAQENTCHWREGGLLQKPTWVRNTLFADGTVRTLNMPLSSELATALLTAKGGETIDADELERISRPELDYKKVYALSAFVLLSLLPIIQKVRQRKSQNVIAD